jgi:hypothetical protein
MQGGVQCEELPGTCARVPRGGARRAWCATRVPRRVRQGEHMARLPLLLLRLGSRVWPRQMSAGRNPQTRGVAQTPGNGETSGGEGSAGGWGKRAQRVECGNLRRGLLLMGGLSRIDTVFRAAEEKLERKGKDGAAPRKSPDRPDGAGVCTLLHGGFRTRSRIRRSVDFATSVCRIRVLQTRG